MVSHLIAPDPGGRCLQAVHLLALPVQADDGIGHLIELIVGHGQTRNLDRDQIVAPDESDRRRPHPRGQIESGRERILSVLLDVGQKLAGLYIGAVTTPLQRQAGVTQTLGEAFVLLHHPVDFRLFAHLEEPAGQELHRAAGHAPISVKAFVDDDLVHELLMVVGVVGRQYATGVALRVLGSIHLEDVTGLDDLPDDVRDGPIGLSRFVLLDVPGVLDHSRPVADQPLPVSIGQRPNSSEVGKAERMLPIGEGLKADQRDAPACEGSLKFLEVHVAGEYGFLPVAQIRILDAHRSQQVELRTCVAGQNGAFRHHRRDDELHRPQVVVCGTDIGVAQNRLYGRLQGLEVSGSGVGFVADKLSGELFLAHGVGTQRAHVEADLSRRQIPHVELSVRQVPLPLVQRWEGEQSDRLYLVWLVNRHPVLPPLG